MAALGRARSSLTRLRDKLRPPADPSPYTFAMLSHPGRVRTSNEDVCAASPLSGTFVVCDGMGGAAAGEVAARLAADTFLGQMTPFIEPHTPRRATPDVRLYDAIAAANDAVYHRSRESSSLHGMGTTLVSLLIESRTEPVLAQKTAHSRNLGLPQPPVPAIASAEPKSPFFDPPRPQSVSSRTIAAKTQPVPPDRLENLSLTVANVGDSRCYLFRNSGLTQLTDDHSLVEEQVRSGELTPQQAANSPLRNIITRAVGSQPSVEPDIQVLIPRSGDLYLLASDGLTRELTDANIETILRRAFPRNLTTPPDLQQLCRTLIDEANDRGGGDNITVLLLRIA